MSNSVSKLERYPLVYGRTLAVDFRFLAIPEGWGTARRQWAERYILALLRAPERLYDGPRWAMFRDDRDAVVGVGCNAADLIDYDLQLTHDITRDSHGRPLYLFVGYVERDPKRNEAIVLPPLGALTVFAPLATYVDRRWNERSYDVVREPHTAPIEGGVSFGQVPPPPDPWIDLNSNSGHLTCYDDRLSGKIWAAAANGLGLHSVALRLATLRDAEESPFENTTVHESAATTFDEAIHRRGASMRVPRKHTTAEPTTKKAPDSELPTPRALATEKAPPAGEGSTAAPPGPSALQPPVHTQDNSSSAAELAALLATAPEDQAQSHALPPPPDSATEAAQADQTPSLASATDAGDVEQPGSDEPAAQAAEAAPAPSTTLPVTATTPAADPPASGAQPREVSEPSADTQLPVNHGDQGLGGTTKPGRTGERPRLDPETRAKAMEEYKKTVRLLFILRSPDQEDQPYLDDLRDRYALTREDTEIAERQLRRELEGKIDWYNSYINVYRSLAIRFLVHEHLLWEERTDWGWVLVYKSPADVDIAVKLPLEGARITHALSSDEAELLHHAYFKFDRSYQQYRNWLIYWVALRHLHNQHLGSLVDERLSADGQQLLEAAKTRSKLDDIQIRFLTQKFKDEARQRHSAYPDIGNEYLERLFMNSLPSDVRHTQELASAPTNPNYGLIVPAEATTGDKPKPADDRSDEDFFPA